MTDSPVIRVLLVDDEPLLREMLQSDPQVKIVGESVNGHEALAAIREHSPDLLFLDVQMPELGGFDESTFWRLAKSIGSKQRATTFRCTAGRSRTYCARPLAVWKRSSIPKSLCVSIVHQSCAWIEFRNCNRGFTASTGSSCTTGRN